MRSWYPIPVEELDRKRLVAEHNELVIMAKTIATGRKAWANHPETNRWRGHSKAMKKRHDELAKHLKNHKSPFPEDFINPGDTEDFPTELWEPLEVMWEKLRAKRGY